MKCKVGNYMVLTVNNDKSLVTRGFYISRRFFSTYNAARNYMIEKSESFKAKQLDIEKNSVYIECENFFVEMNIIDCSKIIEISGVES